MRERASESGHSATTDGLPVPTGGSPASRSVPTSPIRCWSAAAVRDRLAATVAELGAGAGARRPPARSRRRRRGRAETARGGRRRRPPRRGARRGGGQVAGRRGVLLGGVRAGRPDPLRRGRRARRGSGDRPGRVRRRDLDARGQGRPRPHHAAGHGRRRGRREDRHQHRRGQEPGRRVPRAVGRARRPGDPARRCPRDELVPGLRGDRQGRVHRGPGDPRPDRGRPGAPRSTRPARCCPSWSAARSG